MDLDPSLLARFGVANPKAPDLITANRMRDQQIDRIEARWHAACRAGLCRFEGAPVDKPNPPAVDSFAHCGGYHGVRHIDEHGDMTWSWRICMLHRAWVNRRRAYVQEEREGYKRVAATTRAQIPKAYEE